MLMFVHFTQCSTVETQPFATGDKIIFSNITDLQPYTNYTLEVYSVNCGGSSVVSTTLNQTNEWCTYYINQNIVGTFK